MINTCTECKHQFNTKAAWKTLCLTCYKKLKGYTKPITTTNIIDAEMLKRIIYLCHPDKHNQSEVSVIVTKYLLTLK
jgi:hypothetical protein